MIPEMPMKYINFPVQLLQGFLLNPPGFARDVVIYGSYYFVYSEKASMVDFEEFQVSFDIDFSFFDMGEKEVYHYGKEFYEEFHVRKKSPPLTGILTDKLLALYERPWETFDLVVLLMYMALRSIIQKGPVQFNCSIAYLFSRMAGFGSTKEFGDLPDELAYWNTTYRFRKCIKHLEKHYGLLLPKGKRKGITYSFTKIRDIDGELMNRFKLEFYVQKKKSSYHDRALRLAKDKAYEVIKARFKSER